MRKEYAFSKMKGCKNPYAEELKKKETMKTKGDRLEKTADTNKKI